MAVEIGAGRVTAVVLATVDGAPAVTAQATERLPDGLVAPSLTTPNLTDKAAVAAAVQRVLRAVGVSRGRVALVVPDGAAKVSVVRFEKVPAKAEDLAQLVRWQVRKSVPFPIEQSQVSWTPGVTDAERDRLRRDRRAAGHRPGVRSRRWPRPASRSAWSTSRPSTW